MKTLALIVVLLTAACSTVPEASDPQPEPAACGWADDGTCPEGSELVSANERIEIEGGVCWIYTAKCVAPGADVPDSCAQNRYTTCTQLPSELVSQRAE